MADDVYVAVGDNHSCARNCLTNSIQRKIRLLQPFEPLDYVSMDILGPLPKTKSGS